MRGRSLVLVSGIAALSGSLLLAQPGRGGGSQWLTALADAQRTSWLRSDDKISLAAMAKPGFDVQWKRKLDNAPRGRTGLTQGVTAAGVTLFVPMSLVAGSSNNVYALDNDIGYVVWQRQFEASLPAPTAGCPGGIASATRIVRLDASVATTPTLGGGRGVVGYRTLLGEPGEGVPTEGRAGGPGRGAPPPAAPAAAGQRGAAPGAAAPAAGRGAAPAAPAGRGAQATADRIPGSPRADESASPYGFLFRPSGVGYVVSSDGVLHVVGLPSGKDIQKPAPFLPANARWSAPIAVNTTLYTATSGDCGGAPNAVWAIDLDSDAKPVVSWKTNGGSVVGAIAFTPDGTLIAAVGAGTVTGDGKANAIVALDPKTLTVKDWFTQPNAEFATGPTIVRHQGKDLVVAATKDGRVIVLNASSLGGADHATPLVASSTVLGAGASISADALAAWQQTNAAVPPAPATEGTSWILVPVAGRVAAAVPATNGAAAAGAVVAMKLVDAGGKISLAPGWASHGLTAATTPIIVNGVVFTLSSGLATDATSRGVPAVLHAYDGATGKRLWNSAQAMTGPASVGSMWSGLGQVYVGALDGTLYAFGFNDERK